MSDGGISPFFWLANKITEIINKQQADGLKKRNYLQLLLEAKSTDEKIDLNNNQIIDYTHNQLDKKLSIEVCIFFIFFLKYLEKFQILKEIKNNLILFMLAGYETTSTALQYCAYVLTRYPEEQQKLYEEISHYFDDNVIIYFNFEKITLFIYII